MPQEPNNTRVLRLGGVGVNVVGSQSRGPVFESQIRIWVCLLSCRRSCGCMCVSVDWVLPRIGHKWFTLHPHV